MSAFDQINFNSRDWGLMKQYLEDQLDTAMDVMCQNIDQDETNRLRGRILFINMMLKRADFLSKQAASNGR